MLLTSMKKKGCQNLIMMIATAKQVSRNVISVTRQYQDATEVYNRNVFYIVAPIGALAVIIGLFIGYEVVGTGFMFSGIY